MAEVNIKVNNKTYGIACDDGEEDRVRALGQYVNDRLMSVASGGSSEIQNVVLTSIILADEIADLRDYVAQLEEDKKNAGSPRVEIREVIKEVPVIDPSSGMSDMEIDKISNIIERLAGRINVMSAKLAKAA